MKKHAFLLPFLLITLLSSCDPKPKEEAYINYYFDSNYALNDSDGSIEKPFKNLDYISSLQGKKDFQILLKCGSTFDGGMVLENLRGDDNKKIIVTSYGEGDRPKINGNDKVGQAVVYLKNCSNIEVSNLEVYDTATTEADRRGILIDSEPSHLTTYTGITIKNNYVHDIYGECDLAGRGMSSAAKRCGGILVWSTNGLGVYKDLTIESNIIEHVDSVGISTFRKPTNSGSDKISPYDESQFNRYGYKNVKIVNNKISYIAKNGIFFRNINGGLIEHNTIFETCYKCCSGNTIVTSFVNDVIVQYNEGYLNRSNISDGGKYQDGCMLDPDLVSKKVTFQYNYSHDNSFGLFLNCDAENRDNDGANDEIIVRFNFSLNDKGNKGIFYINYFAGKIDIYNNTVVTAEDTNVIFQNNDNRTYNFRNNLILNRSKTASFVMNETSNGLMKNNLLYSLDNADIENINDFKNKNVDGFYVDPLFIDMNFGSSLVDRTGYETNILKTKLSSESVCLSNGSIESGISKDILENPYKTCIGCYSGIA